jgi:hypothetical protein
MGPGRRCAARCDHVHKLGLVGGGHDHEARQVRQIGDVEAPAWVAPSAPTSPRGRWRSAPAGAGSPRHARPGHSRAAGRSNRSRRTVSSRRGQPGAKVTRAVRRCPRRRRLGKRSPNRSSPVPSGIAAVTATILGIASASGSGRWRRPWCSSGAFDGGFFCSPVATSNFATPWPLSAASSAGA